MLHHTDMDRGCRARRGRPIQLSQQEREGLILDAMERVVAKSGLRRASMAAIARAAGMSKRTLYAVYGSRELMFDAWVRRKRSRHVRPLAPEETDLPIGERLRRIFQTNACGERAEEADRGIVVLRAVIAEAARLPDVARTVLLSGAEAAHSIVALELERAVARGEIEIRDVDAAAQLLLDMVGLNPLRALLDPEACEAFTATAEARLDYAVETFLHGHAPQTPAEKPGATERPADRRRTA